MKQKRRIIAAAQSKLPYTTTTKPSVLKGSKVYLPPLSTKENTPQIWFQFGFPSAISKPVPFKQPLQQSALSQLEKAILKYPTDQGSVTKEHAKSDTCSSSGESGDQSPPPKNIALDQAVIEDLIVVEQALYAIEQALKYNQNVAPTCTRWWAVSKIDYASKLQELTTFEHMGEVLNLAFALETISIGIIQYMLNDAMYSELIYGSLKTMSTLIHNNCMRFLELVHYHLKIHAPESTVKETIYMILLNRKGSVCEVGIAEKVLNENNATIKKIINKVMKFKTGSKLFGYSYGSKAKQEKTVQNILSEVLRALDAGSVELKLVRESVRAIAKELPQSVVRQGPLTLPPVKAPFLPPLKDRSKGSYTLVLDLDETLVHYCEGRGPGKLLIRPGAQSFLEQLSQYYEIVVYTAALSDYANWALGMVDKDKKWIKYRLYRQHTIPIGPAFIKDLSKLGRDLARTIIVDNVPENFQLQPENGIFIKTWINDKEDKALQKLAPVLLEIAKKEVPDVRVALNRYKEQMKAQMGKGIKEFHLSLDL